jgi:hypothetical protein
MVQSGINFGRNTCGNKIESILEGRREYFTIFHVEEMKKVKIILRLGKKNYFIGLQNLEAKEIVQKPKSIISNFFLRMVFTWFKSFESLPLRIRSST